MGLYGSEYWTYLLPKRVGIEKAIEITESCSPMSSKSAKKYGIIYYTFDEVHFENELMKMAEELATSPLYENMLEQKRYERKEDENIKPLEVYRKDEFKKMWNNFYSCDQIYHIARKRFVYKLSCEEEVPKNILK